MRATILLLAILLAACGGSTDAPQAAATTDTPLSRADCQPAPTLPLEIPDMAPLFAIDPIGPLQDVTCDWARYQPAEAFCVRIDAVELTPGGTGPLTAEGSEPECRASGFGPEDHGLYKVRIDAPELCEGCRRLFIDGTPPLKAQGHAFYAIASFNPGHTIDPYSHSPNTKNFTNDALLAPPDTQLQALIGGADLYMKTYVTHTTRFAHSGAQGDYYIGPWYLNRAGERIHGVYVDIKPSPFGLGDPNLNAIRYLAGYNSGTPSCPDNLLGDLAGFNLLYAGCVERPGGSAIALDLHHE
ncbi:MAG TPA: hypothetical protein VLI06_15405 [Solimonas sp.]|nr:hypothetical protein [Solimonas sp.]